MKILFTGASSFTGFWFVRELVAAGHAVTATFTANPETYSGLRKQRVDKLQNICTPLWMTPFGGEAFIQYVKNGGFDILCHHAACVTNYKNQDFDFVQALAENTRNMNQTLNVLVDNGLQRVVLTGSVFESCEGVGDLPLRAFSPYGLSKTMTAQAFEYGCSYRKLNYGKFVIPNPFGPMEEPRFTNYLVQTWFAGKSASVKTPDYVRDNIHVSLLAKAYAQFVTSTQPKMNPSGYVESQGAFTMRFAREIGARLKLDCHLTVESQSDFAEPLVRINSGRLDTTALGWNERTAWDEIAAYYAKQHCGD